MQSDVAVVQTEESLAKGYESIWAVEQDFVNQLSVKDRSLIWNYNLIETLEVRNLMTCVSQTAKSALARKERSGSHARDDFPERLDGE
jgi:succinate dehydrogenase (ubiquinone) flavoprotein subunit